MVKTNRISVFDVDDCLLTSPAKIGYIEPDAEGKICLSRQKFCSTLKFARIRAQLPKGTAFNFTHFRESFNEKEYYPQLGFKFTDSDLEIWNKECMENYIYSLSNAKPHRKILCLVQRAVDRGDKIGILTARGADPAVTHYALCKFFDKNGVAFNPGQFKKKYVIGVSNPRFSKHFSEEDGLISTEKLKRTAIEKIFMGYHGFTQLNFFDDDYANVKLASSIKDVEAYLVTDGDLA